MCQSLPHLVALTLKHNTPWEVCCKQCTQQTACLTFLPRSQEARAAQGQQRFSAGYKHDEVLPHTKGLRAYALAALCPRLRYFSMDERASCIGGMTDDMARALAVHCKQLVGLEVYFQRYSLPSELFTDDGLIALTEGCRSLRRLTLHNCDRISDRCGAGLRVVMAAVVLAAQVACC